MNIVAAATLLSAAPRFAIDVDVDPDGNRVDCRRVIVEMPDGSTVVLYRCDSDRNDPNVVAAWN